MDKNGIMGLNKCRCYARNPDVRDLKIALRLLRMTCLGSHLKMGAQTPESLITETCN